MIFILSNFPRLSETKKTQQTNKIKKNNQPKKKKQIQRIQQVSLPNKQTQKVREVGCLRSYISRINEWNIYRRKCEVILV